MCFSNHGSRSFTVNSRFACFTERYKVSNVHVFFNKAKSLKGLKIPDPYAPDKHVEFPHFVEVINCELDCIDVRRASSRVDICQQNISHTGNRHVFELFTFYSNSKNTFSIQK